MNTDFLFFSFSSVGVFFSAIRILFFLFINSFSFFHQQFFSLFINEGFLFPLFSSTKVFFCPFFFNNKGFLFHRCINRVVFLLLFASIGFLLLFFASIGFFLFFFSHFNMGFSPFSKFFCFSVNVFCSSLGLFFLSVGLFFFSMAFYFQVFQLTF